MRLQSTHPLRGFLRQHVILLSEQQVSLFRRCGVLSCAASIAHSVQRVVLQNTAHSQGNTNTCNHEQNVENNHVPRPIKDAVCIGLNDASSEQVRIKYGNSVCDVISVRITQLYFQSVSQVNHCAIIKASPFKFLV